MNEPRQFRQLPGFIHCELLLITEVRVQRKPRGRERSSLEAATKQQSEDVTVDTSVCARVRACVYVCNNEL
jgi:ferredoxin